MSRWALAVALLFVAQDRPTAFLPGEATSKAWTLFGPADVDDATELHIGIRRMERVWDAGKQRWNEVRSTVTYLRAPAEASRRRFEATLKSGPPGRYFAQSSTDRQVLHSGEVALGPLVAMLTRGPEDVASLRKLVERSIGHLEEIERHLKSPDGADAKAREAFTIKVADTVKRSEKLFQECDFTGTLRQLLDALHHIRNVQIWKYDKLPPPATNDSAVHQKHVFIDPDLTLADLRKSLEALTESLASELKVSTALLVDRLLEQAGRDERPLATARAAAQAASKLAEASPVPDSGFMLLLVRASDPSADPAEVRTELLRAIEDLRSP